jgi:heparosan-N-sulfate-glucuronate 5-epimerase
MPVFLMQNFYVSDSVTSGVSLKLDHVLDFILSLNLKLTINSSFTVVLQSREKRDQIFQLHYICSDLLISAQDQHVYHGIGHCEQTQPWRRLTRDLIVDLHKGLAYQSKPKRKLSRSKLKVFIYCSLLCEKLIYAYHIYPTVR